ncbi:MAG: ABC transporter permease [Bacilli bacterium]|nr:ABC transporter permease [Bacilli bacterium]
MKNNIINILKKELREMFRDKKSIAMMLIIPFMIPLLVIGMSALFEYQTTGVEGTYNRIGFAYETTKTEEEIIKELGIFGVRDTEEQLKIKFEANLIDAYITKKDNKYIINGDDSENTTVASKIIETYFQTYKEYLQTNYLENNNLNAENLINIITLEKNIEKSENFFGNYITVYAFLFIIMAITISATYPATDATAGEKERGTLETLLTFPIKSKDIIIGKYLSVTISSIITGMLSLILMIIALLIAQNSFQIYEEIDLMLPLISLIFAIIVIIAYSFLISGLCIAVASKSSTFKSAQSALTPLTFISFFPSMIVFMINIKTNLVLSIIPFLNFTMLFTDITNGNVEWINIAAMLISTFIIIGIILRTIIKQYKSEKVLFS